MAGALDIKRETARIRREQAKRNAEAIAEEESRRNAMEAKARGKSDSRPSDRRRRAAFPQPEPATDREGHRLIHKQEEESLDPVEFASPAAKSLAEEAHLTIEILEEYEASSKKGFTAGDIREIIEDVQAEDEDDEDDFEDESEEKMDDSDYEDKMDRGGEDK